MGALFIEADSNPPTPLAEKEELLAKVMVSVGIEASVEMYPNPFTKILSPTTSVLAEIVCDPVPVPIIEVVDAELVRVPSAV